MKKKEEKTPRKKSDYFSSEQMEFLKRAKVCDIKIHPLSDAEKIEILQKIPLARFMRPRRW